MAQAALVYMIGLDRQTARAIHADLPGHLIRRRRPLTGQGRRRRNGHRPDLVLFDLNLPDVSAELAAARDAWGEAVVAVGIGRLQPFACVWQANGRMSLVEIGPGFLNPLLSHGESEFTLTGWQAHPNGSTD